MKDDSPSEEELKLKVGHALLDPRKETQAAKRLIEKIVYITLATSDDDSRPWNTPLFSAHDKAYNFYWISSQGCVHSHNIRMNDKVALVIYDSTVPEGEGFGVYVEAKAVPVNDRAEVEKALKLLYKRKRRAVPPTNTFVGDTPRKVYKAVPIRFWVNDIKNKSEEMKHLRMEVELK